MSTLDLNQLIRKLNDVCRTTLEAAAGFCLSQTHYNIEIEHWLVKLLEKSDSDIAVIMQHYAIYSKKLQRDLLQRLVQLKTGDGQTPVLSLRLLDMLREAILVSNLTFNDTQIRSAYLLIALLQETSLKQIVLSISHEFRKISLEQLTMQFSVLLERSSESATTHHLPCISDQAAVKSAEGLAQFTIDLTALAREGKLDHAVGRDTEIQHIIDILLRRRQNNPILTGEPGVGKTAVVEGFALLIAQGKVPPALKHVAVHVLDLGLLQAGAGIKGEFENRLNKVIHEVKTSTHPIILFIDEAHTLIGTGGQAGQTDAANLLKPALARGELRTIAATTWAEYKKYFEQDAALARRFQVIKIEEPDEATAIQMLASLIENLEDHHGVRILHEAVVAAVKLSMRYLANRLLPDKAISVLDTACARLAVHAHGMPLVLQQLQQRLDALNNEFPLLQRESFSDISLVPRLRTLAKERVSIEKQIYRLTLRWQQEKGLIDDIHRQRQLIEQLMSEQNTNSKKINKTRSKLKKLQAILQTLQVDQPLLHEQVDAQAIAEVIASWTGIPIGRMQNNEINNTLQLKDFLKNRIMGQDHALEIIAQHLQISRAHLMDPTKPLGIFLLVGPSGVGKTETALALAEQLYGSDQQLTTINLSEFKEEHKLSLLVGSPPGYVGYGEGGVLTEAVRRRPYSLLLLDEVEKAHPGIQDVFYQVFDKGILKDGQGRDIHFKNTVIILTSNACSELISKLCADKDTLPSPSALVKAIQPELHQYFKPAFLGRVTLIPYLALDNDMLHEIVTLQLNRISARIRENYAVNCHYTSSVMAYVTSQAKSSDIGARTIEQILKQKLLPELSLALLTRMANKQKITDITINYDGRQDKFCYQFAN